MDSILNDVTNTFHLSESLSKELDYLLARLAKVHKLKEVDESLEYNHHVLWMHSVVLLNAGGIILEMLVQLGVENGQERHRGIEVLFVLVEEQVHHSKVIL